MQEGVIRSTAGNMPHILQRIAAHKSDLASICSAGMARGHRGNPAASLRIHQLHATPVLLSGVATLVLTKQEKKVLETHYKCTIQRLQRLHQNTPRAVVFFLAGCLPFEAMLHIRQLGLFSMVCHLPQDPLHLHGKYILTHAPPKAKSWFQQVEEICSQYKLPAPLQMLANPLPAEAFKAMVKHKIIEYWQDLLRVEAAPLTSLQYFKPELYSLTRPHYMWLSAVSNPFECSKSTVLARMTSGRYRSQSLCRHWSSSNREGYCLASSCHQTPGTLEHLLVVCPALDTVRERMYSMWLERSVMFPTLHSTIRDVLGSDDLVKVQFIIEPLAFNQLSNCFQLYGQRFIEQLSYLTRTFAFYMNREYQTILKLAKSALSEPVADHTCNDIPTNMFSVSADPSHLPLPNHTSQYDTSQQPHQSDIQTGRCQQHHLATDQDSQPSADMAQQCLDTNVPLLYLPDQCSLIERSHASPTCVPPTIPSAAHDCTTSDGTPAQTCVTDVRQFSGDTPVQLTSPECQMVIGHGQAHGGTSGGEGHHWHDTQQSSLSLIRIHHHPCSCTQ